MKCEGCGKQSQGYDLFDYCGLCGKNLCPACMDGKCSEGTSPDQRHVPSQGPDGECGE